MSSAEFTYWRAHFRIEPVGFHMDNWRAGMIASTVANAVLKPKGQKKFTPDDFAPQIRARR